METPGPFSVSQGDIDEELRRGTGFPDGKLRIYAIYQQEIKAKDAIKALKKEYGIQGHSRTFLDGTSGFVDYRPNSGMEFWERPADEKVIVKWSALEKRIRQMIAEGSYLTPEELEQYRQMYPEQPQMSLFPPPAPEPPIISPDDIAAVLRSGPLVKNDKTQIFALYQHEISTEDAIEAIKNVCGNGAFSHTFLSGAAGIVAISPADGLTLYALNTKTEVNVSWAEVEKGLRQMVQEGNYLTPEEREQIAPSQEPEPPVSSPAPESPAPTFGTSREITQADIDAALQEWNGDIASKRRVQQYMTDHGREKGTADWLRNEYGDDLPAFPVTADGAATDLPWSKVQRNLARLVKEDRFFTEQELDNFEDIDTAYVREQLEQQEDQPSPFVEQVAADVEQIAAAQEARTVREIYEQYKPIVTNLVLADVAYQNACRNSDKGNALIEGNAAVRRAALTITEPEFMRLYYDMPDFRQRLHREIVDETYPVLSSEVLDRTGYEDEMPPWGTEIGNHSPWGAVQMSDQFADGIYEISTARHGGIMIRETDAKGQLSPETIAIGGIENGWCYYEEDSAAPVVIRELLDKGIPATPPFVLCEYSESPVFEENRIYSVSEFDRLMKQADDEHVAGEAAAIKKYGSEQKWLDAHDPEFDRFFGYDKVSFTVVLPDGRRFTGRQDIGDGYGGLLDYLSQNETLRDIVPALQQATEQGQAQPEISAPPDLDQQPVTREGDTITIGTGYGTHEVEITVSDEEWQQIQDAILDTAVQPVRDPLAPAYDVGDKVYLENTEYTITNINLFEVELLDPALSYPVFRSEPKERFEAALWKDARNSHITEFMSYDLGHINEDFREVLTSGLLTAQDKENISDWLRSGEGNTRIGQRLAEQFADRAETMQLITGETADYFTSNTGMEVKVHDKYSSGAYMGWAVIPSVLRALYQQELDGFSHNPVQRGTVREESTTPAEHESAGLPDREPEQAPTTDATPGAATIYPGDRNGLPFDVIIQPLHFDEPEQAQPEQAPTAENFRITDDHLGEGGPKAKFRMNMDAINTLQAIEFEGRTATPEEQEILSRYVGWGGIPDVFDPDKPNWANEYLELKAALTPAEYEAARASVLNAHYTTPTVIKAIYEAVGNMGFTSGNILEPSCGVGNFFGLLPEAMAASKLYGVELDSITGRIAQQLYPKADITVAGFETTDRRNFYDLAVGNVPFGDYHVNDRAYDKLGFTVHNYFAAKMMDQVRPGGVVAFVTSRFTMDSKTEDTRKYLAERADLLGAIRLPNNAFRANAGTDVVTDILFFQKRDTPQTELPDWVHVGENQDGFSINRYFVNHPEMILGQQSAESTRYSERDFTVKAIDGLELSAQLHEAIQHIHGQYREAEPPELEEDTGQERVFIPADPDVKNFSYAVVDGDVYFRENSLMEKQDLSGAAKERVTGMIELRDCVRNLIRLQMRDAIPDSAIREQQERLNQLYDAYTAKFGLINDRGNQQAFSRDDGYYLLCALEIVDEQGRLERKADMFTKRTISPHRAVTSVDTASEALAVSIAEKAKIDMPYMAQLTGKTEEELEQELTGVIFRDIHCAEYADGIPRAYVDLSLYPLVTADEYLSGNVRRKLRMAQAMSEVLPPEEAVKIRQNVEALTAAQPKDLDVSEIEVRLGATWIDKQYIQQFMNETLDTPWHLRRNIKVEYSPTTATWHISAKRAVYDHDVAAYATFGTRRANAYEILEDSLNLRDVRIYDTVEDADGKEKRVLNGKETTLAQQKQQALKDAFRDWIWRDPRRRQALVKQYNEEMNSTRPREYDGSHINFVGMNPEIQLQPHQVNAIAHVLYGGNTLLAHEVGAGKTFEMVAAAMESKRLGLCRKSIFVVPNHLVQQWASEFLRLYPAANVLVTTKKDFEPARRKKFCARIATGDYDAIIIGQSQFEKIPISYARQERIIQDEIREILAGIDEIKRGHGDKFSIKEMERSRRNLKARLEKLRAAHKKDDVVTFEQLGVDRMFVDESDFYKNLFMVTKMRNVAGLSTTDAQKSSDMFAKCRYLDEQTGGRGTIFATGTPISNSMTEMFSIHRYLQYDRLQEMGMGHFDCWASRFGETATVLELAPEGTGYRPRTRFAKFFNLPELMNIFKEVADVKTADQLNLPTPEVEYHTIPSKPTEHQKEMVQELSQRASKVHSGSVDPHFDNMLKITSDGRKLGLDQRIINPLLPDEPGTKVNRCVENVLHFWREGEAEKHTQIIFCDISTPPAKAPGKGEKRPFNIYDDIKDKLIAGGMPPEQIAFIHDAKTDKQKKDLFAKVNAGQVRVIIGSTAKMGAGTNIQKRLIALHDLDCRATRS